MFEEDFYARLTKLRTQKGVSAREMSLAIAQSGGYINKIENKKMLPSMATFFYICNYFNITPKEFFDDESENPTKLNELFSELKKMDESSLDQFLGLAKTLNKKA